jgi:hypothetical protein
MSRIAPACIALLLALGCSRARAPYPAASSTVAVAPPSASSGDAGRTTSAAPGIARCQVTEGPDTIDDGSGRGSEYGRDALENVRILADGSTSIVTWERQTEHTVGDSWRSPAMTIRRAGEKAPIVTLPVMAYACATYGYVAPGTFAEPFVTWGVQNERGFEVWKELPKVKGDPKKEMTTLASRSDRTIATRKQEIHGFAVSGGVTIAVTTDGSCDALCSCSERPMSPGVWLRSLDRKSPFAVQLAKGARDDKPADAPAIVLGDRGGAAAYRFGGALHLVRLDPSGRPLGPPDRFDDGDVGAPALALAGAEVFVVWAKREAKTDPYRLRIARASREKPLSPAQVLPTLGSAFAPAVIANDAALVVAWMEGDASRIGEIRVVRTSVLEPSVAGSLVVSNGELNARDPELSGSVDAPVLVYSTFSKELAGGVIRIARLGCAARLE